MSIVPGWLLIVVTIAAGGGSTAQVGPTFSSLEACKTATTLARGMFERTRPDLERTGARRMSLATDCVAVGQ